MSNTLSALRSIFNDVVDFVYPRVCAACNDHHPVRGGIFCIDCLSDLPQTHFHIMGDNDFEKHFWGRVQIEAGAAFLFYVPDGKTQQVLHNIKYRGHADYAQAVGAFYGTKLKHSSRFNQIDLIAPIPLHWRKQQKRGFNQSTEFAKGLSTTMGIPINTRALARIINTDTQTRKSREQRVKNMRDAFSIKKPGDLEGKHILLVDDVLTTGATLEAGAIRILEVPGTNVSLATIACGRI